MGRREDRPHGQGRKDEKGAISFQDVPAASEPVDKMLSEIGPTDQQHNGVFTPMQVTPEEGQQR